MRKTTILAIATAALAVVTIVTDLIRADANVTAKVSASPVAQVQIPTGLKAVSFDAI
jgi:hypothetical protein